MLPGSPLERLGEAAQRFVAGARSKNTGAGYGSDLRSLEAWARENRRALTAPLSPTLVGDYLTARAQGLWAPTNPRTHRRKDGPSRASTLLRACAAFQAFNVLAGSRESLFSDPAVVLVLDTIKRELGLRPITADPLRPVDLAKAVATLPDSLTGARERAILLAGFAGALRRSEIVGLDVENVSWIDGDMGLFLPKRKTDQFRRGTHVHVPSGRDETCPVRAMRTWLDRGQLVDGACFRWVRGEHALARRISPPEVARVCRQAAARAGLQGRYSGHSLRAGFATSAAEAGVPLALIMKQGGWTKEETVLRYIRLDPRTTNAARGLL